MGEFLNGEIKPVLHRSKLLEVSKTCTDECTSDGKSWKSVIRRIRVNNTETVKTEEGIIYKG
jgi:hypothetical protein